MSGPGCQRSEVKKSTALWRGLILGAMLGAIPASSDAAPETATRPYPHESGAAGETWLQQARRSVFGMERDLPQHPPEQIAHALNDKTLLVVFDLDPLETSFGTHNRPNANVLWYFRSDGGLFLNDGPDKVSRASWTIIDDRILQVMRQSKDPDGANRTSIGVYPLQGFFESILDSGEGDACGIGADEAGAVAYESGKITGSSLEQVCQRQLQTQTQNERLYPTMDGVAANIVVEEILRGVPDYIRNRQVAPEKIAEALVGKTVYSSLSEDEYETSGDTLIQKTKRSVRVIAYFREDGRFLLNASPNLIISGDWMIANDKVLILRPKMPGADGRISVQTWTNPLSQFVMSIRDFKDGDYCEMETRTTRAFVYSNGQFSSSRLGPACGRRRAR